MGMGYKGVDCNAWLKGGLAYSRVWYMSAKYGERSVQGGIAAVATVTGYQIINQ